MLLSLLNSALLLAPTALDSTSSARDCLVDFTGEEGSFEAAEERREDDWPRLLPAVTRADEVFRNNGSGLTSRENREVKAATLTSAGLA